MKELFVILCVSILVFVAAGSALADLTTIENPWAANGTGSEINLFGWDTGSILDNLYGWNNLQRIDDWNASIIDQVWFNVDGSSIAKARFAGYTQNFGYFADMNNDGDFSDESFQSLFNITTDGGYLSGYSAAMAMGSYNFIFADDSSGSPLWTSRQSDNNGDDHMVTWLITGGESVGNYVLAWEDLPGPGLGDQDYNDLVVEVANVHPLNPVPEPATMLLLGSGLVGLAGFGSRFKKK